MVGFAAFMLRAILVVVIGGLFFVGDLLRSSYEERKKLSGQGYGALARPESACLSPARLRVIAPCPRASHQPRTAHTGLAGNERRVS